MTPTHEKPKGFDFERVTVSFRFVLPVMLGGYIVAWSIQQNWQNQRFDAIQNSETKIWESLSSSKSRLDCVQNQLAKCCKDSVYCS